jgi:hypothetical protein
MNEQTSNGVIVSTANIKGEWIEGQKIPVTFMTASQIQERANREGDFLYRSRR